MKRAIALLACRSLARPEPIRGWSMSGLRMLLFAVVMLALGCSGGDPVRHAVDAGEAFQSPTETAGSCRPVGLLPDPHCTPGVAETNDLHIICHTDSDTRRRVSDSVRVRAFSEYGISMPIEAGTYELDHLIPLSLGGSNDLANLWPEAAPGFHQKDVIEDYLHNAVCGGSMSVEDAQRMISTNWTQIVPPGRRP